MTLSILIADDSIPKISNIIDSINNSKPAPVKLDIRQASNVAQAIELLKNFRFHLLITDLLMPIQEGSIENERAGELLIREIYKSKNNIITPIFIIGLTQFSDVQANFSSFWNVWKYDLNDSSWQIKLRDLLFHISKIDSIIVKNKKPTLYVEGITDKLIIEKALTLFYPELAGTIAIEAILTGGGASWVERQLVIWSKTLYRKDDGEYLMAVGLFDGDTAGLEAAKLTKAQVSGSPAGMKTLSILCLNTKYATHLRPAYQSGLKLFLTLEEILSPSCWNYALEQGMLTNRNLRESIADIPSQWDSNNQSLFEFVDSLSLPLDVDIYIKNKINHDDKLIFIQKLLNKDEEFLQGALINFKSLLEEILVKLKVLEKQIIGN